MKESVAAEGMNRRHFLIRSVKAGLAVSVASTLGFWLHDRRGPSATETADNGVSLPDFSIPELSGKLCIVRGQDREKTLPLALKALGGIGALIKRGDRVLIKVNAAFASPPMLCATTHPSLVRTLTRMCLAAGAHSVVVTDNPINDPNSCFILTGIAQAAKAEGSNLLMPADPFFRPTTLRGARLIKNWPILYKPFEGVNKVIGVAPVKDHNRSGASMTMKNWYGLLGGRRNIFHQDIYTIIAELAKMVRPTLVILDGTFTMMTNGPTGGSLADLKKTNTMIVSTDQVAADAFGATLLERSAQQLPYIAKAQAMGVGTGDYQSLRPIMVQAD